MKKGGGKVKGSAFERSVCKLLSLWLSGGVRDDLLWRSAMSGGRATVSLKAGKCVKTGVGDIVAVDQDGFMLTDKFVIECKSYSRLYFSSLISSMAPSKQCIRYFWEKVELDASKHNKLPMLIAKQNKLPTLVLMPVHVYDYFKFKIDDLLIYLPTSGTGVMELDKFIEQADPKYLTDITTTPLRKPTFLNVG